jgi:hypothetical protein
MVESARHGQVSGWLSPQRTPEGIRHGYQSYRERMKAARAEASAQRKAEQAARQRQIELRCEVHRLALAAVKAGIQAKGQRKLSTYSRAELTMMANALNQ